MVRLSFQLCCLALIFLSIGTSTTEAFTSRPASFSASKLVVAATDSSEHRCVQVNDFFKAPVPEPIKKALGLNRDPNTQADVVSMLTAAPSIPGSPRPLWLVILGSLPTGLVWYGYYKFAVEEELLQMELEAGKPPRGFGGYGTLGPFTYGLLLGPIAQLLHLPGGIQWSTLGIVFIYYTQFILYDRVNELYKEQGLEAPLTVWWCLPIFFPFNLIVGLRQVHFLSQLFYLQRGIDPPPQDPVANFFPFIQADTFGWQEFFLTPSLWCSLLESVEDIDRSTLPTPLQELLSIGESDGKSS